MRYCKEYKKEISFPLGGIGSGSIGLAGNGSFTDIEIFNRPNKGSEAGFTHFAIKAEDGNGVIDSRVLNTDLQPGYVGSLERDRYTGYGFGPDRGSMAGFPHFDQGEFDGEFPLAKLDFRHEKFPGEIVMTAFNPFIPTNEDDSSIPAAFFEIEIKNTQDKKLSYTLAMSCNNYYTAENAVHRYEFIDGIHCMYLSGPGERGSTEYGDLTIATDCAEVSYQEYWFRGSWFDNAAVFWQDFTSYGRLKNRRYAEEGKQQKVFNGNDLATLAAHIEIQPGKTGKLRFVLSWSMPYMCNTWQITHLGLNPEEIKKRRSIKWKNYYAVLFADSRESALYSIKDFKELYHATKEFTEILYRSSLPQEALDAVTANISILKSTTCLRLEDGSFYGFEGTHPHMGSCEGTCTHVWSYAYAAAYLFPRMERSARTLEYTKSMQEDGGMGFRLQLPLEFGPTNHRPAADGQYGTVLRVYREYMLSGDKTWLKGIWPAIKKSIAYAWSENNPDRWDRDKDGILEGRQHHTLDMELFSPNAWLSGMYLAGLKAGAGLAQILGDMQTYQEYIRIYEAGRVKLNNELYNGEYYCQNIDLNDRSVLEGYRGGRSEHGENAAESYWNEESGEMKYQIAEGCSIDQILGQWHSDLLGLGEIFETDKVKSALRSIYKYNYIPVMREHVNPCRIYALNDEAGTVICSYPPGAKKPRIPIPYAEETMHGFEYQAASHMIKHGLEKEGLVCVKAVRDKYDGRRRNPWNEMECGSNYARSMASYALLLVYSGFKVDMGLGYIGFNPICAEDGEFFWSVDSGYGEIHMEAGQIVFRVAYGDIKLKYFGIPQNKAVKVYKNTEEIFFTLEKETIVLNEIIRLEKGESLTVVLRQ